MNPQTLNFEHQVIDTEPSGTHNDVCLPGDLTGNGKFDLVIGGKYGADNLVWYENPTWERHVIATTHLEAGGVLFDVNGNGRLDVIAGNPMDDPDGYPNTDLMWFECPTDPRERWTARVITSAFVKYHDQAVGDVDGDGMPELLFASQGAKVIGYFDIPENPTRTPWSESLLHLIATDLEIEGLRIVDIDGDGINEVVAGPNIFKLDPDGIWVRTVLAEDFAQTRVAVADFDGDGFLDVAVSEGESSPGRLAWFRGPGWDLHMLADDLFHPHSLEVADFNDNGKPDLFVGEMGLNGYENPREIVYLNQGGGTFEPVVVGTHPTHDAKVADISGNGLPDIVGKPYHPNNQVDLWLNRST